jgi:hypothetical protein
MSEGICKNSKKFVMNKRRRKFLKVLNLRTTGDAIEAMIKGLKKARKRKRFEVRMTTYGSADITRSICFGCAATVTLQEAAHRNFKPANIWDGCRRAAFLGLDRSELGSFESALNSFRLGRPGCLFAFFGEQTPPMLVDWALTDEDWEEELPKVKTYLKDVRRRPVMKLGQET